MNYFNESLRTVKAQVKVFDRLRETRSILLVSVSIAFLDKAFPADVAIVKLAREVTPYVVPHVAKFMRS